MSKTGGGRGTNQHQVKGSSKKPATPPTTTTQGHGLRQQADLAAQAKVDDEDAAGDGELLSAEYGETPIDEDARDFLTSAFQHIQTKDDLNDAESSNIAVAVAWLRENPYRAPADFLHQSALRELHRRMFDEVWTWAGQIRKRETNLGVDPALIVEQWQTVLGDTNWWIDHNTYSAPEIGVRFHGSMVAIHCFPNGNGRHARLAANELARILGLGDRTYSWGARSGGDGPTLRRAYLDALKLADAQDDYGPLVTFALS